MSQKCTKSEMSVVTKGVRLILKHFWTNVVHHNYIPLFVCLKTYCTAISRHGNLTWSVVYLNSTGKLKGYLTQIELKSRFTFLILQIVEQVDKILGPGNQYVTAAKMTLQV